MWILSIFLILTASIGGYFGSTDRFMLDRLTRENVLNSTLIMMSVFTLLMIAYVLGYFPQSVAAPFMMFLYSLVAGFFCGYALRLLKLRSKNGSILYQYRSFWVDHAPNFLGIILVLYGIFRTAILTDQFVTGIRVTSGISLMSFGLFIWTLKTVPEFRTKGILLLDRLIQWPNVISWSWEGESVLKIEFIDNQGKDGERIKQFVTFIPEDERKEAEAVLKLQMEEHEGERRKILFPKQ